MRILHYALGFPPYRSGGLTKYCVDLMKLQKRDGHSVALMWPGRMSVINKKVRITKCKKWNGISSFELINPLPVALDEGILDVNAFTRKTQSDVFFLFFNDYKPDAIHIHTLMGLYSEFIDVANKMNIKLVYTTHDYYGICPKVTLFCNGNVCNDMECERCYVCNQSALSINKITLLQSHFYKQLKNTALVKVLRRLHRQRFFDSEKKRLDVENSASNEHRYKELRRYYIKMLNHMDIIHFNSNTAAGVYFRYLTPKKYKVIQITHSDIKDNRRLKQFCGKELKLTYLGPSKEFKGFFFLIDVLDKLWSEGITGFKLKIFTTSIIDRPYIEFKGPGYNYSQLNEIFDKTDVLISPSIWYETFGFTVLEALSYGVPVIISDRVGAQDIVSKICSNSVLPLNKYALAKAIKEVHKNRDILREYNRKICSFDILPKQLPYEELYKPEGDSDEC